MAKATTILAAGLMTLVLGNVDGTAEAQNATLTVRVRNDARALDQDVAAAQKHVTQIYAKAGVDVVWVGGGARMTVALISHEQADRMHQHKDAMGYAPASGAEGGRLAYVLNHRVDAVSAGYGSPKTVVLGVTLAHEIGHLLLPSRPHSAQGLMRRKWDESDFRNARRGELLFTPEQALAIREKLEGYFPLPPP
jgi:hypothetical protein